MKEIPLITKSIFPEKPILIDLMRENVILFMNGLVPYLCLKSYGLHKNRWILSKERNEMTL